MVDPVTGAQALNISALQVPGVLEPIVTALQSVINLTKFLVGGLFGLYLIFVIMNWWQGRVKLRLLREIRDDMDELNIHFKIKGFKKHKKIPKRWEKIMQGIFEERDKKNASRRRK